MKNLEDEFNVLEKKFNKLQDLFNEQRQELVIAQQKRSGHYMKLEYQIQLNEQLKNEISALEEILRKKNPEFVQSALSGFISDNTIEGIENIEPYLLERLVQETTDKTILLQKTTEQQSVIEKLESKLFKEASRTAALERELNVAQQKRSGHYQKLEYEIERNAKLTNKLNALNSSLSLSLGQVLVQCKTLKGFCLLPYNIIKANREFKKRKQGKSQQQNNEIQTVETKKIEDKSSIVKNENNNFSINVLGWPKPKDDKPITIMSIADTFTTSNLKSVANLITPRPDNWHGLLDRDKPDFLFVESAWNGNENSWQYRVGTYSNPPGREMFDAIEEFKRQELPTIFWNKEDPVHFDKFKNTAKEFDFIFTSDEGSIKKYNEISKARVFALPFAADTEVHNPIGSAIRENKICFAGSYYANRFSERKDDQLMLLRSAMPFNLDIYDRNASNANDDFRFPKEFASAIKGSLPYSEMNKAYKKYKVFLNVNSVIDSKTMFSRRVFELMASGTPIVSTPSLGIEDFFGTDLVWLVSNEQEAKNAIQTLLTNEREWLRRSLQGIREVMLNHTFKDRFKFILNKTGVDLSPEKTEVLLVMYEALTQQDLDKFIKFIDNQPACHKYEIKPFAVLRNKKLKTSIESIYDKTGNIVEIASSITSLKDTNIDYCTFISKNNLYGKNYLLDLYLSTIYNSANIITKPTKSTYEYQDSFLFYGSIIKADLFKDSEFLQSIANRNANIINTKQKLFAIDNANYVDMELNPDSELLEI